MSPRKPSAAAARRARTALLSESTHVDPLAESFTTWLGKSYQPRGDAAEGWEAIRPFVLEVLTRSKIRGLASLRGRTSDLTHFAAWALERGHTLQIETVMRGPLVAEYTRVGMPASSRKSRLDRRGRLLGLAAQVNKSEAKPPRESISRVGLRPPYTPVEMEAVRGAVMVQPTDELVRQLCLCVGLGAGAGIDSHDLKQLKREHVAVTDEGIRVDVPGARGRVVWVLTEYEAFVVRGIEGIELGRLLLGRNPERANVAATVFRRAAWYGSLPTMEQSRLRTTWLAHHMQRAVPLQVLCKAAGLTSTRTLFDLLPFLPDAPDAVSREALRGGESR